jgi:hypothetical protein
MFVEESLKQNAEMATGSTLCTTLSNGPRPLSNQMVALPKPLQSLLKTIANLLN